jgi:hypothetical protein
MMAIIIREDDFVSRTEGEWRNSSERVIAIIRVRGDKQKTAGKKERACRNRRKQGKKAAREKEKRLGCRKKA